MNYRDFDHIPTTTPKSSNLIWWILGGVAGTVLLGCCAVMGLLMYIGAASPETSVYPGKMVPEKYLNTIRDVGALDDDETLLFFYSDALIDIHEGFYLVSDKKVAIYREQIDDPPLTKIPFDQITIANLERDESFLVDSIITLVLEKGQVLSFPVSSEYNRDVEFFDAIRDRSPNLLMDDLPIGDFEIP